MQTDAFFVPYVLVTGSHLNASHGETWKEITAAGISIDAQVPMPMIDDTSVSVATAMGQAIPALAQTLSDANLDGIVILGDRFEALSVATVAMLLNIPIVHLHGGELTAGAFDDSIRHAITKMAYLHLVSAEPYRRRIIQMGESPNRVMTVGATAIDNIATQEPMSLDAFNSSAGTALTMDFLLVTYHSETLADDLGISGARALASVLSEADQSILVTGSNADTGGRAISALFKDLADAHFRRIFFVDSLGMKRYLAAVRLCAALVGNSSSGIIEAPLLGAPTVNIGDRQKGRLRAPSVIDCAPDVASISTAITKAVSPVFRKICEAKDSPFGKPGATARIINALKNHALPKSPQKQFFDVSYSEKFDA